jgi:alpha-glutamyl/putrescinyl thymine pyrophosphorylase clade 1
VNAAALTQLIWWMRERQRIYRKRQLSKPAPWTTDPVLQRYKFTNVFRQLDRTSEWLRRWWYEANRGPQLPFSCVLARCVNRLETLAELGFPYEWDRARFIDVLERRRRSKQPMVTSAYIVGVGSDNTGKSLPIFLADLLDRVHHNGSWAAQPTLQACYDWLTATAGRLPFVMREAVLDLAMIGDFSDHESWVTIGPGAKRGLVRIFGDRGLWVYKLLVVTELAQRRLVSSDPMFTRLLPRDVEHSLCEFDKYLRAQAGGFMRNRFVPSPD